MQIEQLKRHEFKRLWQTMQARRFSNVLIIDDDVDAAIVVATVFRQFDCNITLALELDEARRRLVSGKADIIILDWMLDSHIRADDILKQSIKTVTKLIGPDGRSRQRIPKVISYSTLPQSEIHIPESPYFEHLAHWQKPMNRQDLVRGALRVLTEID